jgi:hypothetical protein
MLSVVGFFILFDRTYSRKRTAAKFCEQTSKFMFLFTNYCPHYVDPSSTENVFMEPVEFHFDGFSIIYRFILPHQQSALSFLHVYEPSLIFKIVAHKFHKRTLIPDQLSVGNITIKHFTANATYTVGPHFDFLLADPLTWLQTPWLSLDHPAQ